VDARERYRASLDEVEKHARASWRKAIGVREAVRQYGANKALFLTLVMIPLALLQLALVRMQRSPMKF
jgi:hypothetical protein